MSALPKAPLEDTTVTTARMFAAVLIAQGYTAEQCAVLAFVKGAAYGLGQAMVMGAKDDNQPSWPT